MRAWLETQASRPLFIAPGSPWENAYIETFNGKAHDELLQGELFSSLLEARILIEQWRSEYNDVRPDSSLAYETPARIAASVRRELGNLRRLRAQSVSPRTRTGRPRPRTSQTLIGSGPKSEAGQ